MIVIKYCGGLGNQLYQYAMKIALQAEFPNQVFKDDVFHYNLLKEHNGFELPKYFNIKFDYATKKDVRRVSNCLIPSKIYEHMPLVLRKKIAYQYQYYYLALMDKIIKNKKSLNVAEHTVEQIEWKNLEYGDWYISGMWQNLKWFDHCRDNILKSLEWNVNLDENDKCIVEDLETGNAVAVHIRGGDFINNAQNHYELCKESYYLEAFSYLSKKPISIYVFTDDVEYSKRIFGGMHDVKICGYVSHGVKDSIKDMYILSKSRNLVISNSTFAFWGAYLNQADHAKIVAPKYAFHNGKKYIDFCYRNDWHIVENRLLGL